jgi:hypothetical protein
MSTVVDFAMQAAHDRIAAAVAGTAGEALIVARRMFVLGALPSETGWLRAGNCRASPYGRRNPKTLSL